eukprot:sb/3471666/
MCREGIDECNLASTFCGTPDYIAPEILTATLAAGPINPPIRYSTFQPPFEADTEEDLFDSIMNDEVFYPAWLNKESVGICRALLMKDPEKRLCSDPRKAEAQIKSHAFFKSIDWKALEGKMIPPPFRPSVRGSRDFENFDSIFITEKPTLSPTPQSVINMIPQDEFTGFSFVNTKYRTDD